MNKTDKNFMNEALKEAKKAMKNEEVPIGAVVVKNGKVIARSFNNREEKQNAVNHAELLAISKACKKEKSWRLDNATLYVTLEPCLMCAGAALNARISKVVFGAYDNTSSLRNLVTGCDEKIEKYEISSLNHKTFFVHDENDESCKQLLQDFFADKRKKI